MRPFLHARLQNRDPGLLNLPIPIPSIPVLSPILTPLVEGNNQASSPTPTAPQPASSQPASQPAPLISLPPLPVSLPPLPVSLPALNPAPAPPPPQQPPAPQTPPASNPPSAPLISLPPLPVSLPPLPVSLPPLPVSLPAPKPAPPPQPPAPQRPPTSNPPSGGGAGGGSPPSPGTPASGSSSPTSSVDGGRGSPPSGSGSSNSVSPPQGSLAPTRPPNAAPSLSPSGVSGPASPGSFNASSGSTLKVTSTGVVVKPLNNAAASPSSGSTPSNSVQGDLGQSSGASMASATPLTPAGTNGAPNSPHGALGSPNAPEGSNGTGSGSGSTGHNNPSSSASHSHLSSGAIGGIVAGVIVCGLLVFFILRKRHQRRKAERQVKWINGYVTGETADMQEAQRVTSMRSSWGTPIEHRFSDPFRWSAPHATKMQEGAYDNAESPYPYALSHSEAPVLPMPVHSPVEDRSHSPEDPFADGNAARQPIKPLSSLPIRISLISTGSGAHDPFDDAHGYIVEDHKSESNISSATFGHGSGLNRDPTLGTQANFPMPPPTAGSSSTGFAIGSPADLLQLPGILISFPDSPVSPTFAASGTASYPRRASVKLGFQPSQERRDEVQLQQGDQVSVVSVYEDGWAFVQNENNNDRGLVPLNCLELDNP